MLLDVYDDLVPNAQNYTRLKFLKRLFCSPPKQENSMTQASSPARQCPDAPTPRLAAPESRAALHLARSRRELISRCVCAGFGVSLRAMTMAGRSQPCAILARQVSMYLLHVVFSTPLSLVGELFRRDRTTVAHACQRIEDRRDDPAFDAFLYDLELAASALDSAIQTRTKQEPAGKSGIAGEEQW